MLVTVIKDFKILAEAEVQGRSLPVLLNSLKQTVGKDITDFVANTSMKYVLIDTTEVRKPVALVKEVAFGELVGFDRLIICEDSNLVGSTGLELIAVSFMGIELFTTFSPILASLAVLTINLAVGFALSMLLSLLAPTPTFGDDPANTQATSSLFENAPLIRKQGGSCPLVFGSPYCGGVLINIKISSSDVY